MGGKRVAIRIMGVSSTTRGFGFATLEGIGKLVDCGTKRTKPNVDSIRSVLVPIVQRNRPLFIAIEHESSSKKRARGKAFRKAVSAACANHRIMMLRITRKQIDALVQKPHPTKHDVAKAVARRFPEVATKLPKERKPWESENDRIGLFLALAVAVAEWVAFQCPERGDTSPDDAPDATIAE